MQDVNYCGALEAPLDVFGDMFLAETALQLANTRSMTAAKTQDAIYNFARQMMFIQGQSRPLSNCPYQKILPNIALR